MAETASGARGTEAREKFLLPRIIASLISHSSSFAVLIYFNAYNPLCVSERWVVVVVVVSLSPNER